MTLLMKTRATLVSAILLAAGTMVYEGTAAQAGAAATPRPSVGRLWLGPRMNRTIPVSLIIPGAYCVFNGNSFEDGGYTQCQFSCTRNADGYNFTYWYGVSKGTSCSSYNG